MLKPKIFYTISADSRWGPRTATRSLAASAMCLADEWATYGLINILITDPFGCALGRDEFRATLPLARRLAKRRKL